jgi:hypothetical protein
MTDLKFWAIVVLLTLNLLVLLSIRSALGSLWTKLHEMQQVLVNSIARRPQD